MLGNERITSIGIRYSNMLPLHDTSAGLPGGVGQGAAQAEPVVHRHVVLGHGEKLASRASEASRS